MKLCSVEEFEGQELGFVIILHAADFCYILLYSVVFIDSIYTSTDIFNLMVVTFQDNIAMGFELRWNPQAHRPIALSNAIITSVLSPSCKVVYNWDFHICVLNSSNTLCSSKKQVFCVVSWPARPPPSV